MEGKIYIMEGKDIMEDIFNPTAKIMEEDHTKGLKKYIKQCVKTMNYLITPII